MWGCKVKEGVQKEGVQKKIAKKRGCRTPCSPSFWGCKTSLVVDHALVGAEILHRIGGAVIVTTGDDEGQESHDTHTSHGRIQPVSPSAGNGSA